LHELYPMWNYSIEPRVTIEDFDYPAISVL
jgi:hypothetical protein